MTTQQQGSSPGGTKDKEHVQVRYTGDWSSDSKLSAITSGYWEDPFLSLFNKVDPVPRRTSLICRGYYVRFRVCDFFMRSILSTTEEPIQIVSLGCGMDTTFYRMLPQFESKISRFFEVDFESVIQAKKDIIASNEVLQLMQSEKLILLGADLRNICHLHDTLLRANFDLNRPTLFYSECVINYLRPKESEEILKWISGRIPNSIWLAYEQCNANDSFGQLMCKHFERNGCPLLSLPVNPDMECQRQQLKRVGFRTQYVFNVWDAFLHVTKNEKRPFPNPSSRQQFDEYEALLATCLHYSVRIGTSGEIGRPISSFLQDTDEDIRSSLPVFEAPTIFLNSDNTDELDSFTLRKKLAMHTTVSCDKNEFLIFGGVQDNSHRSPSLDKISINQTTTVQECTTTPAEKHVFKNLCVKEDKDIFERLYSAAVFHQSTHSCYIFGGRKSPRIQCDNALVQVSCCRSSYVVKLLNFPKGSSPCSRWRHSLAVISQNLILFGGKNEKEVFSDCWRFDFTRGGWILVTSAVSPSARHSHSMCSDNTNNIYCIGGIGQNETTLCEDAVWKYELCGATSKWTPYSHLNIYGRRIGHSTALHDGILFIVGGYGANSGYNLDHFITLINVNTQSVKVCSVNLGPEKIFLPFGFSVAILNNEVSKAKKMVVHGGGGNCFSFGSHYNDTAFVVTLDNNRIKFFD